MGDPQPALHRSSLTELGGGEDGGGRRIPEAQPPSPRALQEAVATGL